MADITISSSTLEMANTPRAPAWIALYAMSDFWLADRTPVMKSSPHNGGVPYLRVALSPAGTNPTVYTYASFSMPSTEDALLNPGGARWGLFLLDSNLRLIDREHSNLPYLETFRVPSSPSTNNLQDIAGFNTTSLPPVNPGDASVAGTLYAVDGVFTGDVTAANFFGNGAGLTGIATGTGGVTNTGSTTIGADTDSNADGIISLQTRTIERMRVNNDGSVDVLGALAVTGLATLSLGASVPGTKQLSFTSANVAAPSLTDSTIGSRILLYAPAAPDHIGFGVESGAGWFQTGDANAWKYYFAAVHKHTMTKEGMAFGATSLNSKAILQADSTTRGFLAPRMTTGQRDAIAAPPEGLVIFNLTTHRLESFNGTTWDAEYLDGSGTVGAYPIFTDADSLGNGYLKQIANGIGIDGTAAGPYFDIMTTGLVGDANYTKARLYAEASVVELTALAGGTHSAQSTSIRLKCIGATGDIQFEDGTGIGWKINSLNIIPQNITSGIGLSSLPLGTLRISSQSGIHFFNSNVNQARIRSDSLNHITFLEGDGTGGAILDCDTVNVTDDAYAAGWNASTAVPTKNAIYDKLETALAGKFDGVAGVKVYRALLTQAGTAAPTATVLENSLGGSVVWSYTGPGDYLATLTGAFTANKTMIMLGRSLPAGTSFTLLRSLHSTANEIIVYSYDVDLGGPGALQVDNVLTNSEIEILVYP